METIGGFNKQSQSLNYILSRPIKQGYPYSSSTGICRRIDSRGPRSPSEEIPGRYFPVLNSAAIARTSRLDECMPPQDTTITNLIGGKLPSLSTHLQFTGCLATYRLEEPPEARAHLAGPSRIKIQ